MTLNVTPGTGAALKTVLDGGEHVSVHQEDATQRAALLAALDAIEPNTLLAAIGAALGGTLTVSAASLPLPAGAATQTTAAAILAKIIAAPSTEAKQDAIVTALGLLGTQTTAAAILAKITANAATEAKQDTQIAAAATIGTRAYGAALSRVAVAATSAVSGAVTGTEVLVHASTRCFIKTGSGTPAATTDDIPLEAGEKFHLRITSGHKVAVIRDTADGFLNIVPVA